MAPILRLLSLVPVAPIAAAQSRHAILSREAFAPGSDDLFVNSAVKGALLREPLVGHAGIHVSTSRGVVQLSGFVASRQVMARAVAVARAVDGVRTVRNDMRRA
jgi:osmotically-inducible protein OsmY